MTDGAATGGGRGGGLGAAAGRAPGYGPPGVTGGAPSEGRILFVISAYSGSTTGNGGHYCSARDIAATLQASWPGAQLRILVLGDLVPAAIRNGTVPYTHISPAGRGLLQYCREVIASTDDFAPTIVHAYDNKSYFFARQIARRHRAKRFLTKPAGPGPGITFPYCPDVVCFSEENLAVLRSRRRLKPMRLHYIPERVTPPAPDHERIAALREKIGPGDILLRICRIGDYHRGSVEQTLALARAMRAEGVQARAVVVGALESQAVLDSLRARAGDGDVLLTEPAFAAESAALLDAATYVVGTGRGVVEAAMRRRIVFVPVAGAGMPALVTPAGWRSLAWANFSARTVRPAAAGVDDFSVLQELLPGGRKAEEFRDELAAALTAAYGPGAIPGKYEELYSNPQDPRALEPVDRAVNSGSFLAAYLRWRWFRRRGPGSRAGSAGPPAFSRRLGGEEQHDRGGGGQPPPQKQARRSAEDGEHSRPQQIGESLPLPPPGPEGDYQARGEEERHQRGADQPRLEGGIEPGVVGVRSDPRAGGRPGEVRAERGEAPALQGSQADHVHREAPQRDAPGEARIPIPPAHQPKKLLPTEKDQRG